MIKLAANRTVPASRAFLLLAIVAAVGVPGLVGASDSRVALSLSNPVHGLPLAFERYENRRSGEVQFVSRTPSYSVFLGSRHVTMAFRRPSLANRAPRPSVRMRLLQSNPSSVALAEEPQLAKANYFIGNDPTRWRTSVSLFGKVRFPSVYKNVDLVYYGNDHQLEYDFVIRPGGEPTRFASPYQERTGQGSNKAATLSSRLVKRELFCTDLSLIRSSMLKGAKSPLAFWRLAGAASEYVWPVTIASLR